MVTQTKQWFAAKINCENSDVTANDYDETYFKNSAAVSVNAFTRIFGNTLLRTVSPNKFQ